MCQTPRHGLGRPWCGSGDPTGSALGPGRRCRVGGRDHHRRRDPRLGPGGATAPHRARLVCRAPDQPRRSSRTRPAQPGVAGLGQRARARHRHRGHGAVGPARPAPIDRAQRRPGCRRGNEVELLMAARRRLRRTRAGLRWSSRGGGRCASSRPSNCRAEVSSRVICSTGRVSPMRGRRSPTAPAGCSGRWGP